MNSLDEMKCVVLEGVMLFLEVIMVVFLIEGLLFMGFVSTLEAFFG